MFTDKPNSKTPNFDKALDEILKDLKPHQKTCPQCQGIFDIFQEDIPEKQKELKIYCGTCYLKEVV